MARKARAVTLGEEAPAEEQEQEQEQGQEGEQQQQPPQEKEAAPSREARLRERGTVPQEEYIAESRKLLKEPLQADQAFFEAPDGFITVGDKEKRHVWYARGNKGKGMWINQRR